MPSKHLVLCRPILFLPSVFPSIRVFPVIQFFTSGIQNIGVLASASVLSTNIQDLFPLGLTRLVSLQSKGHSRFFTNTTVQKYQFFSTQFSLSSMSRHACHEQQECGGRSKSVLTGISRMAWREEPVLSPARGRGFLWGEGRPGLGTDKLGWLTCFSAGVPLNRGQWCPVTGVWVWENQTKRDSVKTVETMCICAQSHQVSLSMKFPRQEY